VLILYAVLLGLTYWLFQAAPTGFVPDQDKGRFLVNVQLPDAAALERTQAVVDRMEQIVLDAPGVKTTMSYSGRSLLGGGSGPNFGSMYVILDDFDARASDPNLTGKAIQAVLEERFKGAVPEGRVLVKQAAPIDGISAAGGFKFMLKDLRSLGNDKLQQRTMSFIAPATRANDPEIANRIKKLDTMTATNPPQLYADVDRTKLKVLGVPLTELTTTWQTFLGSAYINNFNQFGRTWQVVAQADMQFRDKPESIAQLKVRNDRGQMVPLGAVAKVRDKGGPINIGRYNMYPAAAILGLTRPGISTGQGIEEMERLCAEVLSPGMDFEWTEINYMQVDASKNIWNNLIFPLAVVFVFLVLAAQYESWALPLAVILVVPMCILGSLTGVAVTNGDINIFTQIGFVVLVGLASKNAILIVEFAKHKREEGGLPRRQATLEACQLRLRPILMTSFAFILGVVPLIVGYGAGAEMRKVLGIAVFSGMLGVTLFGIFLTPVFFYVIEGFVEVPLFSSARARQIGSALRLTLGVLTGGLLWLPTLLARSLRRQAVRRKQPAPSVNGTVVQDVHGPSTNGKAVTHDEHRASVNDHEKATTTTPAGLSGR
jgi:multidrug efflux pump